MACLLTDTVSESISYARNNRYIYRPSAECHSKNKFLQKPSYNQHDSVLGFKTGRSAMQNAPFCKLIRCIRHMKAPRSVRKWLSENYAVTVACEFYFTKPTVSATAQHILVMIKSDCRATATSAEPALPDD